ncbi:MAG: MGMT family protein [Clostridia bacterium]|nr:MGMT family protein [Clostridia bacterium]
MSQKSSQNSVFERIYNVVKRIPQGKVATYGQVAMVAGNPRWARVVGYALHCNPDPENIPCYRVVNREGRVSPAFVFGGQNVQIEMRKADGVRFLDETHVDMANFCIKTDELM